MYIQIVPRMADEGMRMDSDPEVDAAIAMVMLFDGVPRKDVADSPKMGPKLIQTKRKRNHRKRSREVMLRMMFDNYATRNISPTILLLAR